MNNENETEIVKTIYSTLRDEILEKMRFSNQMVAYKFISIGAILGFVASNEQKMTALFLNSSIITSLMLAIAFDMALYQNNKAIINVGQYIKENIEPLFKKLGSNLALIEMWEEYLSNQAQRQRRKVYNIFEAANYMMTLLLMVSGIFYFFPQYYLIFVIALMILIESCIVYKGLMK